MNKHTPEELKIQEALEQLGIERGREYRKRYAAGETVNALMLYCNVSQERMNVLRLLGVHDYQIMDTINKAIDKCIKDTYNVCIEYHKGENCLYHNIICQEGYCMNCYIYSNIEKEFKNA